MATGNRRDLPSRGVDELIQRLRADGVQAGEAKAEELVTQARQRAKEVIAEAEREAAQLRRQAKEEAARFEAASRDALRGATRDALLDLKTQLSRTFENAVHRMVTAELADREFLRRLIQDAVSGALGQQGVEVLLPQQVVDFDAVNQDPAAAGDGALSEFVRRVGSDAMRGGVQFRIGDHKSGLRLRLKDEALEYDLTDQVVSELLLAHLLPRYRGFVEGVISQ